MCGTLKVGSGQRGYDWVWVEWVGGRGLWVGVGVVCGCESTNKANNWLQITILSLLLIPTTHC